MRISDQGRSCGRGLCRSGEHLHFSSITSSHTPFCQFRRNPINDQCIGRPGGKITPSREHASYQGLHVFLYHHTGYRLFGQEDVLVDGVSVGPVYLYIFPNITASHSIVASFSPGITISATSSTGKITPSGSIAVYQRQHSLLLPHTRC